MQTKSKEIGIIGIGDMGGNIARVLLENGYSLALYNRDEERYKQFAGVENAYSAQDVKDLIKRLSPEGNGITLWLMLPPGDVTNGVISDLSTIIPKDSIVIDGSNSYYKDSISNYEKLKQKGAYYLDVGSGGGPDDVLKGTTLMIGGDRVAFDRAEELFKTLTGEHGNYGYVGGSGSGHKIKFIHNAAFYVMFPVFSELTNLMLKMKEDSGGNLDVNMALKLLHESRPINGGILTAISEALKTQSLPKEAPQVKVSPMVSQGVDGASDFGVKLNTISAALGEYDDGLDEDTRRIYLAAKKILTGH